MNKVFRFFLEDAETFFGLSSFLARHFNHHPEFQVRYNVPQKTASAQSVTHWHHWLKTERKTMLRYYSMENPSNLNSFRQMTLDSFIDVREIPKWKCDIREIAGLQCSKSDLNSYSTLDDMAEQADPDLISEISEQMLNKHLAHEGINILHHKDTPDLFVQYQWDNRIFCMNSDGSHHLAAARYTAKKINKPFFITGRMKKYSFNRNNITPWLEKNSIFVVNGSLLDFGNFREILHKFSAPFYCAEIPQPHNNMMMVVLPKNVKRFNKAANIMKKTGFYDLNHFFRSYLL